MKIIYPETISLIYAIISFITNSFRLPLTTMQIDKEAVEKNKKAAKNILIGFLSILLIGFILIVASNSSKPSTKQTASQESNTINEATPHSTNLNYEILATRNNQAVDNIDVLIKTDETQPQAIAEEVKKSCKKQCNINLYDDKKAFDLQVEYDNMMTSADTQQSQLTDWKTKNYIYVGDHYIGSIDFDTNSYNDYPFKDWYYKELKGEK